MLRLREWFGVLSDFNEYFNAVEEKKDIYVLGVNDASVFLFKPFGSLTASQLQDVFKMSTNKEKWAVNREYIFGDRSEEYFNKIQLVFDKFFTESLEQIDKADAVKNPSSLAIGALIMPTLVDLYEETIIAMYKDINDTRVFEIRESFAEHRKRMNNVLMKKQAEMFKMLMPEVTEVDDPIDFTTFDFCQLLEV